MALSEEKVRSCSKRLLLSRMRILINSGFYGLLLMHMKFALDEECSTAATDGYKIYFGPEFLESLSDSELDFVMMHEVLHAALCHCARGDGREHALFNIACDIVVNSNILFSNHMNKKSITLKKYGEFMHLTPNGDEGHKHTAEEVYEMLSTTASGGKGSGGGHGKGGKGSGGGHGKGGKGSGGKGGGSGKGDGKGRKGSGSGEGAGGDVWDDHSRWGDEEGGDHLKEVWAKRVIDAAKTIGIYDALKNRGTLPLFAERMLEELRKPQTDWRALLEDFIQEEVCDYSFTPPDRRFGDSPFFLPDFNDKEFSVTNILFMIDTSGSMSDEMITAAYSEVKGAIDQFNGKLKGRLGFFDAEVIEPKPFESEEEFKIIRPQGGGGTSFEPIFDYVNEHMTDEPPVSIIILTDGYAPFPEEDIAHSIPVLWLINNEEVSPPWGRVARIKE